MVKEIDPGINEYANVEKSVAKKYKHPPITHKILSFFHIFLIILRGCLLKYRNIHADKNTKREKYTCWEKMNPWFVTYFWMKAFVPKNMADNKA